MELIKEEKVKWHSKKKYNCKRNKGEHEWNKPELLYHTPDIIYVSRSKYGTLFTQTLEPENIPLYAEVSVIVQTTCKHCGKKKVLFLSEKIK